MDAQQVIDMVSQRVRDTANVEAVFGKPIQSGEVTMIPVATVKVAGGGGGGVGRSKGAAEEGKQDRGLGLGLHVTARPLGYIEVINGRARMVNIVDKNKLALSGLLAGGLFLVSVLRLASGQMKR
ncbi:MAG TPA: spore germination protein GerW family protein [Candidatus Saccharimonadia bacterium]